MTPLKCPNPRCTFLFDPSKVPVGATLACPTCGMKFTLDKAIPTPATPPNTEPAAVAEAEDSQGRGIWAYLLPIGAGVLALSLVLVGVILLLRGGKNKEKEAGPEQRVEAYNFSLAPPVGAWAEDDTTKNVTLGVNVAAYKREDPNAWVAFAAKNYEYRNAKPGELRQYLDERVAHMFDNLHVDDVPNTKWLGEPAIRFQFRGTAKVGEGIYAGEAMGVSVKGIAYWFFAWAPEKDVASVSEQFETIRGRFKILNMREKWQETAPATNTIAGPGFKLTDTEALWKTKADPKDEDPNANLLCVGIYKPRGKSLDVKPEAQLVGYTLDAKGTPAETAKKYLEERYNRDAATFGKAKLEEVLDAPLGDLPPGEMKNDGVVRFKLTRPNSPTSTRLIVVNALALAGKVVVVEANCSWAERFIWENRLIHFVGTLKGS